MIKVTFTYVDGHMREFSFSGHAEYADHGEDIVCAAISALVIATTNAIDQLTNIEPIAEIDETSGYVHVELPKVNRDTDLLTASLRLAVEDTAESYPQNIKIRIVE